MMDLLSSMTTTTTTTTASSSSSSSSFSYSYNYHFEFENGYRVDLTQYPPAPVTWFYTTIDVLCRPLQCTAWREYVGVDNNDSWFSAQYKVPSIHTFLPTVLSYSDFRQQQQQQQQHGSIENNNNNNSITLFFSSLYQYAFQTPSTALGRMGTMESLIVLLFLVCMLRTLKKWCLPYFSQLGLHAAQQTHGMEWTYIPENQIRIVKFGEYVFRFLYHSCISVYGIWYFHNESWFWTQPNSTLHLFQGFPHHEIEPGLAWYYLLQAAYNLDAFVSLLELSVTVQWKSNNNEKNKNNTTTTTNRTTTTTKGQRGSSSSSSSKKGGWLHSFPFSIQWKDTVRGDFQEMMIHHLATNALVMASSFFMFARIGALVFLVHDISDVPVDMSKLANFLKWKVSTIVCFVTMTMVWFYTRLYILPFVLYKGIVTQCHYVLQEQTVPPICYICYRHFFYIMLALLIALHFAWFCMFLRMFATLIMKNECHDYSEHKHGEKQHQQQQQNNNHNESSSTDKGSKQQQNVSLREEEKKENDVELKKHR